jgi:hypothetical protein
MKKDKRTDELVNKHPGNLRSKQEEKKREQSQ